MKKLDNLKNLKIFFVGIGGISMSGLAKMSLHFGAKVEGSDITKNQETIDLENLNIKVYYGHKSQNIKKNCDLVVFSGAIHDNNIELITAKKYKIPVIERSKFLGYISKQFARVIAVSGTHGKTTTTAMIGEMFINNNMKPTIHLGGESVNLKSNTIIGEYQYLIVEACEYRESFRFLRPQLSVITNIECDHLDYYKNLKSIVNSFGRFAKNSQTVITNSCTNIKKKNVINVDKIYLLKEVNYSNLGYDFVVYKYSQFFGKFRLNMLGLHNVNNALFAIAVADFFHLPIDTMKTALENFNGVRRRYEKIGVIQNLPVIIDYAHHPTEIKNSIDGIKNAFKNILVIFQPHTFSRTLKLFNDFVFALSKLNHLIIYKTYPARESEIIGGRACDLYEQIFGTDCDYADNLSDLLTKINEKIKLFEFDCILVLGAGDLAENLRKKLK